MRYMHIGPLDFVLNSFLEFLQSPNQLFPSDEKEIKLIRSKNPRSFDNILCKNTGRKSMKDEDCFVRFLIPSSTWVDLVAAFFSSELTQWCILACGTRALDLPFICCLHTSTVSFFLSIEVSYQGFRCGFARIKSRSSVLRFCLGDAKSEMYEARIMLPTQTFTTMKLPYCICLFIVQRVFCFFVA